VDDLEITPKEKKQGITIEEKILWCFEFALGITHRNYLIDDLHCKKGGQIVNQPFYYLVRRLHYLHFNSLVTIVKQLNSAPLTNEEIINECLSGSGVTEKDRLENVKAGMMDCFNRIEKAEAMINQLKDVDFTKVKTVGEYKVK
jgi:hypothetical protein